MQQKSVDNKEREIGVAAEAASSASPAAQKDNVLNRDGKRFGGVGPSSGGEDNQGAAKQAQEKTDDKNGHKKTTGEKLFNKGVYGVLMFGGVFLLSVWVGYAGRYGSGRINGKINEWYHKLSNKVQHNPIHPLNEAAGDRFAMTTALMMGGNFFVIPAKFLEDNKSTIVEGLNEVVGKPGEVEQGKKDLENEPKQTWPSMLGARLTAWCVVFVSLWTASKFYLKHGDKFYGMGDLEKGFANKVCKITGKSPVRADGKPSTTFGVSEVGLIDLFASAAASFLLFVMSKIYSAFGIKKSKQEKKHEEQRARFVEKSKEAGQGAAEATPPTEEERAAHEKQRERFRAKQVEPAVAAAEVSEHDKHRERFRAKQVGPSSGHAETAAASKNKQTNAQALIA